MQVYDGRKPREIGEIAGALAKAQGEMQNAPLNKVNPHFKAKYADLAAIRDAVIPALSKHGIAAVSSTEYEDGRLILRTTLIHSSGQYLDATYPLPVDKPQVMGSAITYAKRYTLAALCGIAADEDDDANAANDAGTAKAGKPVKEVPTEPVFMDWQRFGLVKTRAAEQLRELGRLIKSDDTTPDEMTLDAHLVDHQELIEAVMQCSDWWPDVETQIQKRRDELRNRVDPVAAMAAG